MSPSESKTCGGWEAERPKLWIAGLGSQYPPHVMEPDDLDRFAREFFDTWSPGLRKLLAINERTGIKARSTIRACEDEFNAGGHLPTIEELDSLFRKVGVELTVKACKKAIQEWGCHKSEITHTIGVTCTTQGHPGYDLLVNQALGLEPSVDRMLLHGVGCAGGLAIMRAAAQIAAGATAFGRPARILAFACELCTPNGRCELTEAEKTTAENVGIAGALFSDASAAFILCNDLGLGTAKPLFELLEWGTTTIPETAGKMSFFVKPDGYRTIISRDVPGLIKGAIRPMFDEMMSRLRARRNTVISASDVDWALHPGGTAVIDGVKEAMRLTEHQLRASREVYRTKGNSSSPTVLIVLDRLVSTEECSEHAVAASFGPGLTIEMAMLRRYCHAREEEADLTGSCLN